METLYNTLYERSTHSKEEVCAFVLKNKEVVWVDNVSSSPEDTFIIKPQDYLRLKTHIAYIFHSHPKGGKPSEEDFIVCRRINIPMLVCSVPNKMFYHIEPKESKICLQYTYMGI